MFAICRDGSEPCSWWLVALVLLSGLLPCPSGLLLPAVTVVVVRFAGALNRFSNGWLALAWVSPNENNPKNRSVCTTRNFILL
jgi:hypothetical protein